MSRIPYGIWDVPCPIGYMGYGLSHVPYMGYGIWGVPYFIWDMECPISHIGYGMSHMGYGLWDSSYHISHIPYGSYIHHKGSHMGSHMYHIYTIWDPIWCIYDTYGIPYGIPYGVYMIHMGYGICDMSCPITHIPYGTSHILYGIWDIPYPI